MGGGKQPSNTSATQKVEPWAGAQPYYTGQGGLYQSAAQAYANTPKTPYGNDVIAGPNAVQKDALTQYAQQSASAGTGGQELRQLAMDTLSGKFMDPTSNQWLASTVQAAQRPLYDQLTQNILPGMADASQQQGAYGGSRQGVLEAGAVGQTQQAAGDISNRMYSQNYQLERDRQLGAGNILNQATQILMQPAQMLDKVGTQLQNWDQDALDNALQLYKMDLEAPWAGLGEFASILNGGGFRTGTSTVPGMSRGQSALQGAVGGASSAAQAGYGMGGQSIGAILGSLGGLFGG